jgi:hypothetical protein
LNNREEIYKAVPEIYDTIACIYGIFMQEGFHGAIN